jgi:hypothetical protein
MGLLGTHPTPSRKQQLQEFYDRYFHHPDRWAQECIEWPAGHHLIDYQAEAMRQLALHHRHAFRGPRGTGKTTVAALLLLHFAITRSLAEIDWKCVTTANYWRQLQRFLWPEVHKWQRRIKWNGAVPRGPLLAKKELLTLSLHLPPDGDAFAVASDDNESMEGAHATHVLYIFDESKIIPSPSWDSVEGAASNATDVAQPGHAEATSGPQAYWFASSIPGHTSGRFYDICRHAPGFEDWSTQHVSMAEVVRAGQMAQSWADARKRQWTETNELYQNHVLGEFAETSSDSLIPLSWIEAAQARWHERQSVFAETPPILIQVGVDVGRGGDKTVLAPRTNDTVLTLTRTQIADTMDTAGRITAMLSAHPTMHAMIDLPGVGSGVYDRVREQYAKRTFAFNPGSKTEFQDRTGEFAFVNTRSAALWHLRELLDPQYEENIALPPEDMLAGDLTGYRYRFVSGGKIQVESKRTVFEEGEQTLVHRLGRSPDDGDAVVMAFWRDLIPAPPTGGGHRVRGW